MLLKINRLQFHHKHISEDALILLVYVTFKALNTGKICLTYTDCHLQFTNKPINALLRPPPSDSREFRQPIDNKISCSNGCLNYWTQNLRETNLKKRVGEGNWMVFHPLLFVASAAFSSLSKSHDPSKWCKLTASRQTITMMSQSVVKAVTAAWEAVSSAWLAHRSSHLDRNRGKGQVVLNHPEKEIDCNRDTCHRKWVRCCMITLANSRVAN